MGLSATSRVVFGLVLMVLVIAPPTEAQQPTDQFEGMDRVVDSGDRVTIVGLNGIRSTGRVADLTKDSIAITTGPQQKRITFPATDVGRVVRKDSVRNSVLIGAAIGGGVGLVGGLLENGICSNESGACLGVVPALMALGAAGGAGIGWSVDSAIGNHVVFERRSPNLPREHHIEFFAGFGTGRADASGSNVLSAAAGMGRRSASGIGVEGEVRRTLGGGAMHDECVIGQRTSGGSLVCLSPTGRVGARSLSMGTLRIVYTLTNWRVQPFVSGGASLQERNMRSIQCCSVDPQPLIYKDRYKIGVAFPFGGGVRIRLTPAIAFRPEFLYYAGEDSSFAATAGILFQRK